jgi:hypothetical protein
MAELLDSLERTSMEEASVAKAYGATCDVGVDEAGHGRV